MNEAARQGWRSSALCFCVRDLWKKGCRQVCATTSDGYARSPDIQQFRCFPQRGDFDAAVAVGGELI